MAGKCDEPSEKEYFDQCVRPLLTENDRVFGPADAPAKRELLARARCVLFPVQWEEPFGMVMIESMACGTPVVALRGGAVPEVIVDGVTGIICDDPAELPDAIGAAGSLEPAACRRHVAANLSVSRFGSGHEQIYRRMVDRRPTPNNAFTLRRVVGERHRSDERANA